MSCDLLSCIYMVIYHSFGCKKCKEDPLPHNFCILKIVLKKSNTKFLKKNIFQKQSCKIAFWGNLGPPMGPRDPWERYIFFLNKSIFDIFSLFRHNRPFGAISGCWDPSHRVDLTESFNLTYITSQTTPQDARLGPDKVL